MTHATTGEELLRPQEEVKVMESTNRLHYMDNIRALAMMLGVLFHAALAYSPFMHDLWFTTGDQSSWVIDFVAFFTHLFRMPVFFMLSGFFVIMLIQKRGISGMLKNRALRILLPFIIFLPLVMLGYFVVMGWGIKHVENLSPLMQYFKMMETMPDLPKPEPSTTHLWFLFNLMLFIVMTVILFKAKLFNSVKIQNVITTKFLIFVFPLLLVPALANQFAPHPAPERFYPELWSFGFYGLLFIVGSFIYLRQNILDELEEYKHALIGISVVGYGYFFYSLPQTVSGEEMMAGMVNGFQFTWSHLPVAIAEAYTAVAMSLYVLLMGKRYLNKQSRFIKIIADSSYWVYIVHMPVLLMVQFAIANIDMNMWIKFFSSSFLTLAIGFISYLILVRWTPIGWMLNGRK